MQKRQIIINAIMSVLQIVVISIVLLILYKFILNTIGVEQLGIWSVVLATTAVTQIANFGLSGSVVKFVAKYIARNEDENASGAIQTAAISISVLIGFILLAGYPFAKWILGLIIPPESLLSAFAILPYAFLALWIMIITSIFQAGLDGCQRIDYRCLLLMGGAVFHLFLCFILVPTYGLKGLAYARVIQNGTILLISWLVLKKCFPSLPFFPCMWDRRILKEMINYGINFQVISMTTMLYDPTTKALLSKFGGLSMVGYYEMASKMINQFRALIVSSNQVLVPAIAELNERAPDKIDSIYLTSYQLLYFLSVPLYSLIIVCIPLISELWVGQYEEVFVIIGSLLAIGWFLNTLNAPAYFANLGIGELRWNVIGHLTIAILNACLGFLLGLIFAGMGVVIAWVCSLALGSAIIPLSFHLRHKFALLELLPKDSRIMTIPCLVAIILTFLINLNLTNISNSVLLNKYILFSYFSILFILFWLHPMRKRMIGWAANLMKR